MRKYQHYIAEDKGACVELLVSDEALDQCEPSDFFLSSAEKIEFIGDVEMSGDEEHQLADYFIT